MNLISGFLESTFPCPTPKGGSSFTFLWAQNFRNLDFCGTKYFQIYSLPYYWNWNYVNGSILNVKGLCIFIYLYIIYPNILFRNLWLYHMSMNQFKNKIQNLRITRLLVCFRSGWWLQSIYMLCPLCDGWFWNRHLPWHLSFSIEKLGVVSVV